MKLTARAILMAAASAASFAALAQEVAGRVVVSAGDVTIVRGAQRIPAPFGTQIRAGDQVELGDKSNAQVLFTDQSVVALRSETSFKVEQYEFQGKPAQEQKTLFSLLKGGMRTVTGLIGRVNHDNYAVKTPTATVGIRGTNYTLVQCDAGCRNPNGTAAPSGTYGAVTDGRIGVTNQSGERQFGSDQYFHVASQTSAPTQLIAPPQFLRDTLEGRARAKERQQEQAQARAQAQGQQQQQQQQASSGSSASSGAVASSDDSRVTSTLATSTVPVALTTNVYQSTTAASVTGPSAVLTPSTTGTIFYRLDSLSGPLSIPVNCGSPPCSTITGASFTLSVNTVLQRAYLKADFATNTNNDFSLGTPLSSGGIPITISGGQITFSGGFNRADFPNESGAFKCFNCNGTGVNFIDSIGVSGVINGSQATLNFTGNNGGNPNTFTATLTQQTPPNNLAAAATIPFQNSFGYSATSNAYWGVALNASGQLTRIGVLGVGATNVASIGSATPTTVATFTLSDGSTLTGGFWSNSGASVTDANFATFTSGGGTVPNQPIPWIVGTATNTLPATLGSNVTYTPVGGVVSNGSGTLNSALLTADFVNQKATVNINASNGTGATFQMNGSSGISSVNGRFSSGFSQVSCSGTCPGGSATGSFAGFFAGKNAEGAGMAFAAGTGSTSISGVMGMKR